MGYIYFCCSKCDECDITEYEADCFFCGETVCDEFTGKPICLSCVPDIFTDCSNNEKKIACFNCIILCDEIENTDDKEILTRLRNKYFNKEARIKRIMDYKLTMETEIIKLNRLINELKNN